MVFVGRQKAQEKIEQWENVEMEMEMQEVNSVTNLVSILSDEQIEEQSFEIQSLQVHHDVSAIFGNTANEKMKESVENTAVQMKNKSNLLLCDDCGYFADRKNNLFTHREETCKVRRELGLLAPKDKECKYCHTKMRHNALRAHLRHLIKAKKAKKNINRKHALVELNELVNYLEEIKMEK